MVPAQHPNKPGFLTAPCRLVNSCLGKNSQFLPGIEIAAVDLGEDAVVTAGERFPEIPAIQLFPDRDVSNYRKAVLADGVFEILHVPNRDGCLENVAG